MMRKYTAILLLICAVMMELPVIAAARMNEKTARKELQESYKKVVDAYRHKDAKAYASLFSPDIKLVSWDGKKILGRQALEEYARQDMATIQTLYSAREVINKITIKGQKITKNSTDIWKYKMLDSEGTYGAKGKTYDVLWKQTGQATYIKTNRGLLIEEGHYLTKPDLTTGGKPLRPLH